MKPQKADYTTTDTWEELNDWQSRDHTHQSQADRWDAAKSRYTPSDEGLYYVSVNLIIAHSIASKFHVMVAGDGKTNVFSGCQNYLSATSSTNLKFSFTTSCSVMLSPSHYISVYIKSIDGGSWSVLVNSSISIALISPLSNRHRAGYNSAQLQLEYYKNGFNPLLPMYESFDYGSRYSVNVNLVYKPSIPALYILVSESGLYYVNFAVMLEQHGDGGFVEYRIALCKLSGNGNRIVPFAMLASKNTDGPMVKSTFCLTASAVVYLTKGIDVHVCHAGGDLFYKINQDSAFSLVRIIPRDMDPGLRQTGVASVKDVSSRDWTVVSDWSTRAESSLYRLNIMNPYGQKSFNAPQGTYLLTSSLSLTVSTSTSVSMCIGKQNCSQCYLTSLLRQGGLTLAGLVSLSSQQSIDTCVSHKSVAVDRSAQLLPHATANTSLFFRHPSLDFTSSGSKTLNSWSSDSGVSIKNINVPQGLYILTINAVLRSTVDTVLKVSVYLDTEGVSKVVPGLQGVSWAQANQPVPFGLTSLVRISANSSLDITVHSGMHRLNDQLSIFWLIDQAQFNSRRETEPRGGGGY